jgi:putative oxidoreductase
MRVFCWTARIALGWLLLYSGLMKLRLPFVFLSSVYSFDILNASTGFIAAIIVPSLEITLGVFLVTGVCLVDSLAATTMLFAVFSVALSTVLYRKLHIPCGCFGLSLFENVRWVTLARTLGLCTLSALLLLNQATEKNLTLNADGASRSR